MRCCGVRCVRARVRGWWAGWRLGEVRGELSVSADEVVGKGEAVLLLGEVVEGLAAAPAQQQRLPKGAHARSRRGPSVGEVRVLFGAYA